jgi:hypothetical protein
MPFDERSVKNQRVTAPAIDLEQPINRRMIRRLDLRPRED